MSNKPLVAIVDDDEPMRRATSNLLESAGFATATFPDAEAFLGSGRRQGVACLVTDMRMPGMTGTEATERNRDQETAVVNRNGGAVYL